MSISYSPCLLPTAYCLVVCQFSIKRRDPASAFAELRVSVAVGYARQDRVKERPSITKAILKFCFDRTLVENLTIIPAFALPLLTNEYNGGKIQYIL